MHCHPCLVVAALAGAASGCTDKSDADYRADVVVSIHDSVAGDLDDMVAAAYRLQAAAPSYAWDPVGDAGAIAEMREQWKRCRTAYEHVEGAVMSVFPRVDHSLDARYEEMMGRLGPFGDRDLFDARGVTGMHAIERILYAPTIRPEVIEYEQQLPGYLAAAYPATDREAIEMKTVLLQQLIDKATSLRKQWQPAVIDVGTAYRGVVGLMYEAEDKVDLAITGEEESRYANITLFDLRANLAGTQKVYGLFRDWIHSKAEGAESDSELQATFDQLATLYATVTSDALPEAPAGWTLGDPSPADLATPFGAFWQRIHESVDPNTDASIVSQMNRVAALLGLAPFVEP